jgi:hypothetical protein
MNNVNNGFTPRELRSLKALKRPEQIQRFLDEQIHYDVGHSRPRCRSPRTVLRERRAACMDGALFAAAALRVNGHPPLLLDLEAERDDDHVLAIFRQHGCWGAIAKSNYSGLRFREPVYRTLRELVMSYFEHYYNLRREKTLRNYSRPIRLTRFDSINWMTSKEDLWTIPEYLCTIAHRPLNPPQVVSELSRVDARLFHAGLVGRSEKNPV